jgi:hypothetical protein
MWQGYLIRADYNENFFARYRLNLLIKMEKNDSEEGDLSLKFSEIQYDHFRNEIFNITRGDLVAFNATIIFEGDKKTQPVLEAFGFSKKSEHIYIHPHIHSRGRYSTEQRHAIHKNDSIYKDVPSLISDEEIELTNMKLLINK